jgi:transposase
MMFHVGLDLSRSRVDVCVLDAATGVVAYTAAVPDADGLRGLVGRVQQMGSPPVRVRAAIESMTGARYVRDVLTEHGWEVLVADAAKVKGLAPLACKTDRIDAAVLAELSARDLVPAIWLPPLLVRQRREQTRYRTHLVKHRSMYKHRIHSTLMTLGVPVKVSDLFGVAGRARLAGLDLPEPWAGHISTSLALIDGLGRDIDGCEAAIAAWAHTDPAVRRLRTLPGVGDILGATIAAEIGDITRFATPGRLVSYTGLCPRVYQSGHKDRRGPISKTGPAQLRWALIEATTHACRHPAFAARYQRTKTRLGRHRGARIARVQLARELATAIWYMLTREEDFDPKPAAGAANDLAA